ncbi:substrate-binding domain-containing protein [Enterobacter hormaechei]
MNAARMTEEKGRQLILADGKHSAEEEREAIQYLLDMRCDAVIIYRRFLSVEALDEIIEKCEQPITVLNRRLRKNSSHSVWSDSQSVVSGRGIAAHRERPPEDCVYHRFAGFTHRGGALSGYRDALAQHGIAVRDALIAEGKRSPASGAAAVSQLLTRGEAFTALVASNDDMAIGAIRQLHESGVATPGAVSVIGFDDVAIAPISCRPSPACVFR